jgi:hypothetical protein
MSEKISWSFSAQVTGGPYVSASADLMVDAYDKINATIPKGGTETTVEVQPGNAGIKLLVITASNYDDLTYKVDTSTIPVTLDAVHLLFGEGTIALFDKYPTTLKFKNASTTDDVTVSILVGRDATP